MVYEASYVVKRSWFDELWEKGSEDNSYDITLQVVGVMESDPFGTGDTWYKEFDMQDYRFFINGEFVTEYEIEEKFGTDLAVEIKSKLWQAVDSEYA